MSVGRLSTAAQLRYMLQWFEEWSELQRQDFLPLLAEKLAQPAVHLNGVVSSMAAVNCQNKPMSLFQCRIKLFNEWYPTWNEEERTRFVKGVSDADPGFGAKLQGELAAAAAAVSNGDHHGSDGEADTDPSPQEVAHEPTDESPPEEPLHIRVTEDPEDEIVSENAQENILPLEIAATS